MQREFQLLELVLFLIITCHLKTQRVFCAGFSKLAVGQAATLRVGLSRSCTACLSMSQRPGPCHRGYQRRQRIFGLHSSEVTVTVLHSATDLGPPLCFMAEEVQIWRAEKSIASRPPRQRRVVCAEYIDSYPLPYFISWTPTHHRCFLFRRAARMPSSCSLSQMGIFPSYAPGRGPCARLNRSYHTCRRGISKRPM